MDLLNYTLCVAIIAVIYALIPKKGFYLYLVIIFIIFGFALNYVTMNFFSRITITILGVVFGDALRKKLTQTNTEEK